MLGGLLGLGTTAAAYAEEPGYRMCSEYSVRRRVCVFDKREEGLPGASVEGIWESIDSSTYS